jgi:hypothetical protein
MHAFRLCKILLPVAIISWAAAGSAQAALTISTKSTISLSCSGGVCSCGGVVLSCRINVNDLEAMLTSEDVTLISGSHAKDIDSKVAFSWSSAHRLTLDSYRSITAIKPITIASSGALTLTTNDGGSGGALSFTAPGRAVFWDLSSSLVINGVSYTLVGDIATLASSIAATPSGHFALANNYDATSDGIYAHSPILTHFTGAFEGLGNRISKLAIVDTSGRTQVGLFSWIDTGGAVENLGLTGVTVRGGYRSEVGGLAAVNFGLIANSFAMGSVSGGKRNETGVLVGGNAGRVVSSHSAGSAQAKDQSQVGGLIGNQGGDGHGGVGSTLDSYSTAKAAAGNDSFAGGLVGLMGGSATNSWASGAVTVGDEIAVGPAASAGGLVGYFDTATSSPGAIANSYAIGAVTGGQNTNVGGLIGVSIDTGSGNHGPISDSYSTGTVENAGGGFVGGLIGSEAKQANSDDYWDTTTSGIADLSKGAGNFANDPGITGLTTAQLQSGLPAGFDPSIWSESPSINGGLPYLIATPPP